MMSDRKEEKQIFDHLYLPANSDIKPPYCVATKYLINGELLEWKGETFKVYSPIWRQGTSERIVLGEAPMQREEEAIAAVKAAHQAYANGLGKWPQMSCKERIAAVEAFVVELGKKRDEIVRLLMWEICKNEDDAKKEVDRTIVYMKDTISELKKMENNSSTFHVSQGVVGHIRRAPLGVVLVLGPFNYPLNETYTTLIPALIMGNTVVMKLPRNGLLCHIPTLDVFQKAFPPGVVNIVSGSGRTMMTPIMKTGLVDILAFIGTSEAAAQLKKVHPHPHRLRVCLGLDAKNPAIILPSANIDVTVSECLLGSLSFNGQRCTAIKIIFVHESIVNKFLPAFANAVDKMVLGLPFTKGVGITPLAEPEKPKLLKEWIEDAQKKGAKVINKNGNQFDRSFVFPTILYPVDKTMECFHKEQFAPLIPVASYKDIKEIYAYLADSHFGQQASVFGTDPNEIAPLIDVLVNQVSRVNINAQCQRGPDNFPFTGRKNSAAGTLSVHDALRVFSIRSMVATKENKENQQIVSSIVQNHSSNFVRVDYLF